MDPQWLNKQSVRENVIVSPDHRAALRYGPEKLWDSRDQCCRQRPIAIAPSYISAQLAGRMRAQKSVFTLHGLDVRPLDEQMARWGCDCRLHKIVIPGKKCISVLLNLKRIAGVTDSVLFPDVDGLAREIQDHYGLSARQRDIERKERQRDPQHTSEEAIP